MTALIAHPNIAEALDAFVDGPDAMCDCCGRDLYAGIDEWQRMETDDGSGGVELYIHCERCNEDEIDAWLDEVYDEVAGP